MQSKGGSKLIAIISVKQYEKRKQKIWKFKCYLGKNEFGKDVRTTRSGFKTQKEAKQDYQGLRIDFNKNKLKQNGNITFEKIYNSILRLYFVTTPLTLPAKGSVFPELDRSSEC